MADTKPETRSVEAVTASRKIVAAATANVGQGLARLFGDPAAETLPDALADLLAALDRPANPPAPPLPRPAEP